MDMTIPTADEIRNAMKGAPKIVTCAVCGLEGARNTSKVNDACPTHKRANLENWAEKLRLLEKALGETSVGKSEHAVKFNAQLTWLRENMIKARKEHETFAPVKPESQTAQIRKVLTDALTRMGHAVEPNPDPESKGLWEPLALADALLHAICEKFPEVAAATVEQPAQTE